MAVEYEAAGYIDPLSNLKDRPVFVYSGGEVDEMVPPKNQEAQALFYKDLGSNVEFVTKNLGHTPPLADPDCSEGVPCGYDAPGAMLEFLMTNLQEDPITSW